MTKDEALKLALEALEYMDVTAERYVDKQIPEKAIACLRLVIDAENISSKPMAWEQFYPEMGKPKLVEVQDGECKRCTDGCPACDARKLPEQEPVAWAKFSAKGNIVDLLSEPDDDYTPLYTTPPQRTWVGLTDEEIKRIGKLDLDSNYFGLWYDFARAIEAKLKEKNT